MFSSEKDWLIGKAILSNEDDSALSHIFDMNQRAQSENSLVRIPPRTLLWILKFCWNSERTTRDSFPSTNHRISLFQDLFDRSQQVERIHSLSQQLIQRPNRTCLSDAYQPVIDVGHGASLISICLRLASSSPHEWSNPSYDLSYHRRIRCLNSLKTNRITVGGR